MEKTLTLSRTKIYLSLTKPGIVFGNAITAAGGCMLAFRGSVNFTLFFATLFGLCCVIASACVCNNYIDKETDAKMSRTKNRALVLKLVSAQNAFCFALFLGVTGASLLFLFSSPLAACIALLGFFVYVVAYSFSKYHFSQGTLIGSIAGAVPPVVGYCAVSHHIDAAAWLLFFIVVFWQMPHFFAIAIYRIQDYASASIPVLPLTKGTKVAKIHMVFYIIALIGVSAGLYLLRYVKIEYLFIVLPLESVWLMLSIKGFKCSDDRRWARSMFLFSLVVIIGTFSAIAATPVSPFRT